MEIQKELNKIRKHLNSMECPDCGGLHQCRLHYIDNKIVQITFINGLLEPCCGYKSMVYKAIDDFKKQLDIV